MRKCMRKEVSQGYKGTYFVRKYSNLSSKHVKSIPLGKLWNFWAPENSRSVWVRLVYQLRKMPQSEKSKTQQIRTTYCQYGGFVYDKETQSCESNGAPRQARNEQTQLQRRKGPFAWWCSNSEGWQDTWIGLQIQCMTCEVECILPLEIQSWCHRITGTCSLNLIPLDPLCHQLKQTLSELRMAMMIFLLSWQKFGNVLMSSSTTHNSHFWLDSCSTISTFPMDSWRSLRSALPLHTMTPTVGSKSKFWFWWKKGWTPTLATPQPTDHFLFLFC